MSITTKSVMLLFVLVVLNSCQTKNTNGDGTNGNFFNVISNPKDDLIGDFSTKEKGKAEIRVTKQGENYFVSVSRGSGWANPEQLIDVKDEDFAHLFGNNWKEYVEAGLNKSSFGIFKIKKGYQSKDHIFTTGYFMVFLGGGDIYKL